MTSTSRWRRPTSPSPLGHWDGRPASALMPAAGRLVPEGRSTAHRWRSSVAFREQGRGDRCHRMTRSSGSTRTGWPLPAATFGFSRLRNTWCEPSSPPMPRGWSESRLPPPRTSRWTRPMLRCVWLPQGPLGRQRSAGRGLTTRPHRPRPRPPTRHRSAPRRCDRRRPARLPRRDR